MREPYEYYSPIPEQLTIKGEPLPGGSKIMAFYGPSAPDRVSTWAGTDSFQVLFDTDPNKLVALIYDPLKVELATRSLGRSARDLTYAVQQLQAEDYAIVGYNNLGNVFGIREVEKADPFATGEIRAIRPPSIWQVPLSTSS